MLVVGLMSGTSVDAIDAILVEIDRRDETLLARQVAFRMCPLDEPLRERVQRLLPPVSGSTAEVCEVHVLLGEAFADAARQVVATTGMDLQGVDLLASHGQTVYHQVAPGAVRSTLQLGAAAVLAERSGRTVAADFRPRDMAAGGEGAPLVPYLDALLFHDPSRNRALQNIGGMANVTYLPAMGNVCAFDTGPGNVLIDEIVRAFSGGAEQFDRDGRLAAAGSVDEALVAEWLQHPYFNRQPPKSTGREAWGQAEARRAIEQGARRGLRHEDIVATFTALTARSIAEAYRRFLGPVDEVMVSGGGAHNRTLLAMFSAALPGVTVRSLAEFQLDADAKEALAFAVLGYTTLHGWPNSLPAATGARHAAVLGSLTPGANYRALLQSVLASPAEPPQRLRLLVR